MGVSLFHLEGLDLDGLALAAKAAQSADSDAMFVLLKRMQPEAAKVAARVCYEADNRPDVANAALEAVWRGVASFDPERGTFAAYANKVMSRAARSASKKFAFDTLAGAPEVPVGEEAALSSREPDPTEAIETVSRYPRFMSTLSARQKNLLSDRLAGWSPADIARREGTTRGAVCQRLNVVRCAAKDHGLVA